MFKPQRVVLLKSFEHFDLISMVDKSKNHGKLLSTCFLQQRAFPNTKQCMRANHHHFGGKMWQPSSAYHEFQRACRGGENKLSNVTNFLIQRSGEGSTSFNGNKRAYFGGEKQYKEDFRGVYFREGRENVKLNAVLVVVLVFGSKALLFTLTVLTSISVEISRKVARARKRKINRPTITLFSWSYS